MDWNIVITGLVLTSIILIIWAKISDQTVIDLLRDIREFLSEIKENSQEKAIEITG